MKGNFMSMEMDRLRYYVEKRMQTIMIGALSKFEENFGHLWGHFLDDEEPLTSEQLAFADDWERTRNQILNQGNAQIRNNKDDFDKWGIGTFKQKYSYNLGSPKPTNNTCKPNCQCNNSKNK
jgi:hypothetical protein